MACEGGMQDYINEVDILTKTASFLTQAVSLLSRSDHCSFAIQHHQWTRPLLGDIWDDWTPLQLHFHLGVVCLHCLIFSYFYPGEPQRPNVVNAAKCRVGCTNV